MNHCLKNSKNISHNAHKIENDRCNKLNFN